MTGKRTIDVQVLILLRDCLREKGAKQMLTDDEYDALLHVNALINMEVA